MAAAPVGALLVGLTGWALGTSLGACIAAWMAGRARAAHALAVGELIRLAGIANNLMIPPPPWFWAAGLVVPLAAAWAAACLAVAQGRS